MATNLNKGELLLIVRADSTPLDTLNMIADRLGVTKINNRDLLVGRIEASINSKYSTKATKTPFLDTDVETPVQPSRVETHRVEERRPGGDEVVDETRHVERPRPERSYPRDNRPRQTEQPRQHVDLNQVPVPAGVDRASLFGRIRGFLNRIGLNEESLAIVGVVFSLVVDWLEEQHDKKVIDQTVQAVTVVMDKKILAVMRVLETPDLADNAELRAILTAEIADATRKAGTMLKKVEAAPAAPQKGLVRELIEAVLPKEGASHAEHAEHHEEKPKSSPLIVD